ncbi:hypothetical protein HDZ31DRAFT_74493 [Schizophyllum fasciatum]
MAVRALNTSAIPNHRSFPDQEWHNVFKALDAAISTIVIFKAVRSNEFPAVRKKFTNELLPLIWEWMRFFHAYTKIRRGPDQDLVTVAKTRHKWNVFIGRTSLDGILMWTDLIFHVLTGFPEGLPALRAQPNWAQVAFDIWKTASRTTYTNCQKTIGIAHSLEYTLCRMILLGPGLRDDLLQEVASRGVAAGRALAKRWRRIISTYPESMTFKEAVSLSRLCVFLASSDAARPALRPLLWIVGDALCMVDVPASPAPEGEYGSSTFAENCEDHANDCLTLLLDLRGNLHGARDMIRLLRTSLLRGMCIALRRCPTSIVASKVDHALDTLINPTLVFPSVLKAFMKTASRDALELHVPSTHAFEAWNRTGDLARARYDAMRCSCGDAFYCSKTCQKMHWPHHRVSCRIIRLPKNGAYSTTRHFDWYFVRHIAREDARKAIARKGICRDVFLDYTSVCAEEEKLLWHNEHPRASNTCVKARVMVGNMATTMDFGAAGLGCEVQ